MYTKEKVMFLVTLTLYIYMRKTGGGKICKEESAPSQCKIQQGHKTMFSRFKIFIVVFSSIALHLLLVVSFGINGYIYGDSDWTMDELSVTKKMIDE